MNDLLTLIAFRIELFPVYFRFAVVNASSSKCSCQTGHSETRPTHFADGLAA